MYCFGIDVGGTTVKCGLFQTDGTLVDKWEIPTRTEDKGEHILPDVAEAILDKISEKSIDKKEVAGVGIGIPGPINSKGEAACAVNLYWGFKPVAKELGELTGLPAKAGNDANVAALGEAWKGAAAGAQNVIMVTLGNKGCLEQYTSATGIVRLAKKALADSQEESLLRNKENLEAKDVLDAFKAGDSLAVRVMDEVGEKLGGALGIFAAVVDPEAIVIGGGVSKAGQPLIDCIQEHYKKYAFSLCKDVPIVTANLGNDAGIYGAAKMVL